MSRTWLLRIMKCIDEIGRPRFSLSDVYAFEGSLRQAFPRNRHIREKIRQQLQVLRDNGYIRFAGAGVYEVVQLAAGTPHR
jgi:type II restriction enzyme